jgi:hypothetical protein
MWGHGWQNRLGNRWDRRIDSRATPDTSGRTIAATGWRWRLTIWLLILALVAFAVVSGGPKQALVLLALYGLVWGLGWWWRRRQVSRLSAFALGAVASERTMAWSKTGLTYELGFRKRSSNDPASWLHLRGPQSAAVLTVRPSGDAQIEWKVGPDFHSRRYSLSSGTDLRRCVDELEKVVQRSS